MAGLSISSAQGLDGAGFTGTLGGQEQAFLVPRESLEDLEYAIFETPEALLEAFGRQQEPVTRAAAQALAGGAGGARIVLQSLL